MRTIYIKVLAFIIIIADYISKQDNIYNIESKFFLQELSNKIKKDRFNYNLDIINENKETLYIEIFLDSNKILVLEF